MFVQNIATPLTLVGARRRRCIFPPDATHPSSNTCRYLAHVTGRLRDAVTVYLIYSEHCLHRSLIHLLHVQVAGAWSQLMPSSPPTELSPPLLTTHLGEPPFLTAPDLHVVSSASPLVVGGASWPWSSSARRRGHVLCCIAFLLRVVHNSLFGKGPTHKA
jgi:hypothetical protein